MVRRRDIDGNLCPALGGGLRHDTDDGVFVLGTLETVADFTRLAGCGCGERGIVGGVGFDGAERVALGSGEGDVAGGVGDAFFGGGGVEA